MFRKISNFLFNSRLIGLINFDIIKSNFYLSSKLQRINDFDMTSAHETKNLNKKLTLIKMEHQIFLEKGERVPKEVSDENWLKLVNMATLAERRNHYKFLFELYEISKIKKQVKKQIEIGKLLKQNKEEISHISYGLSRKHMFIYLSNTRMTLIYNWFLIRAVVFGQVMVIDLGYDHLMDDGELQDTVDQIRLSYSMNKISKEPWNLYFCNAKIGSPLMRSLKLAIPNLETSNCLVTITDKSYLDIFPKEKLKYLCGDSQKCIENLDYDSIYIIGGFVDKYHQGPASLVKAKRESVPAFHLPLYKYLPFDKRNLSINQVAGILLTLKSTGDWKIAVKHIPLLKQKQCVNYDQKDFRKNVDLCPEIKSWFFD